MRKFSKFFVSLFLIFGTAVFSSCINDAYSAQDFEVSITGEQLAAMMESSRTIVDLDDSQIDFKLIITLVVNNRNFDQRIFRSNLDDARKTGFDVSFNRVPVGSKAKVKVELITFQGEKVYAESNTIRVTKKPQELTLKIGPFTVNPVISSNIVLKGSTGGYYQFSDIDNAKIISGTSTAAVSEVTNFYTFDNEGNVYYIRADEHYGSSIWYDWYLYSVDNSVFSTGKKITPYNTSACQDETPQICIDRSDNSLYVLDQYAPKIFRFPDLTALTGNYTTKIHEELILQDSGCYKSHNLSLTFAVNEGFIYILEPISSYTYSLVKAKQVATADSTVFNLEKVSEYTLNFKQFFGITNDPNETINGETIDEPYVSISDMIYMDGYVYMTACQFNVSYRDSRTKGGFSRGALIRIDDNLANLEICGFNNTSFNLADKYLYATDNLGNILYDSNTPSKQKIKFRTEDFGNSEHTFHAALNNISSTFVGPQRIVAIKPKKLVILDSGVAFYTDDDNILSFKKVNRLVEVDLLNFVIGNTNDDIGDAYTPATLSIIDIKRKAYQIDDSDCNAPVSYTYNTEPYEVSIPSIGYTAPLYLESATTYSGMVYHSVLPKE